MQPYLVCVKEQNFKQKLLHNSTINFRLWHAQTSMMWYRLSVIIKSMTAQLFLNCVRIQSLCISAIQIFNNTYIVEHVVLPLEI